VLLADSAKFPGSGVATVCGPEALDTVVTDAPLEEQTAAAFTKAGVTIVEAVGRGNPGHGNGAGKVA
jgi:DeoR/GlpR family transcriptional regulator of sugar metabolism